MTSPERSGLGSGLGASALLWAAAFVAADVAWVGQHAPDSPRRLLLPLVGLVGLWLLAGRDRRALGWNLRPRGGWRRLAGLGLAVSALAAAAFWWGGARGLSGASEAERSAWIRVAVLAAPWVEEGIYRLVLVPAVSARAGRLAAVLASGLCFAGIHQLTGSLTPVNAIAGFALAFAFTATECFWLPWLLHAAGNAVLLWL